MPIAEAPKMARPIESTPVLKGKDAQRLFKEAGKKVVVSPAKRKELERHLSAYQSFSARLKKAA